MGIGNTTVGAVSAKNFHARCHQFPALHDCIAQLVARRYRSYIELTRIMSLKTPSRVPGAGAVAARRRIGDRDKLLRTRCAVRRAGDYSS
jgi:hypothetical protein